MKSIVEWLRQFWFRLRAASEFLCDDCRYDHPSACHHPERPNARKCTDYRPKR